MHTIFRIVPVLLAFLTAWSGNALAQGRQVGLGKEMLDRMHQELKLTDEQFAAITRIADTARMEMEKLREDFDGDRGQLMALFREYNLEVTKKIEAHLTDEQKEQYRKMRERFRQHTQDR